MPGREGTGPMGLGAMTGRGLGACTGVNAPICGGFGFGWGRGAGRGFACGFGRGWGLGFRRGFGFVPNASYGQPVSKEALLAQRDRIKDALDAIEKQLESM